MTIFRKIWYLLGQKNHNSALKLLSMMLIGMVLETLGIGLLIPLLGVVTTPDLAGTYPALVPWIVKFGTPSQEQIVVVAMLILVTVYAFKAVFLAYLAWRQSKFSFGLQVYLSNLLFAGYLRQPYTFHLQRNSAQLIRNVTGEVNEFIGVLQSSMLLITEGLVMFGIAILLLVTEPLGALLVMTILGFASWGFHKLTKTHILRWGERRQYHEGLRLKHLQQGLGGAKDIKLLGREANFKSLYNFHNSGSAHVGQRQATLQQLPRLWLELLAVIGLAALVLIMIVQNKQLNTLLPILGLFAAAAFRLMPSVNRVIGAIQSLRFGLPVINTLCEEVKQVGVDASSKFDTKDNLSLNFDVRLALKQLYFSYPKTKSPALKGINLHIDRGASTGFIGGSGAGKSTLVDVILGLLQPESGEVTVDGKNIMTNVRSWQDLVGYVPQSIYLTDDTLRRNIAFGLADDEINDEFVISAIHAAQLNEFVNDQPKGINAVVGERGVRLSGGQRQRIGIARALYHDPSILVLDEATSALDTATEHSVMKAIKALQGRKTIIIVAHRLSTVKDCDMLYLLEEGQVIDQGKLSELVLRHKNLQLPKAFGA